MTPEHREDDRSLVDALPEIVFRAEAPAFRFTFVSSYAEALLGYPLQQWTAEPSFWRDHVYPEDRESIIANRLEALNNTGAYDIEYRMLAADGRTLWLHEIGHLISGDSRQGEVAGAIVDLTAKRSEKGVLGKSKLWLRQLIDTIPQQIWSGDSSGTLDFFNSRCLLDAGVTLAEVQGDGWQRVVHPEDREGTLHAWHDAVVKGTPYERQHRLSTAGGQYHWYLTRAVPQRDEQGRVTRWYGTNTDIEDQKRAEGDVRRQEQRWRAMFDNAYVGVGILNSSNRFTAVNCAFAKMLDYSWEELRRMTVSELIYEDDRGASEMLRKELWSGKRDRIEIEERITRKNGEILWIRANGSVLRGSGGEPRYFVVLFEDITERKRLHDELERERDLLRLLIDLTHRFMAKLDVSSVIEAVLEGLRERAMWDWTAVLLPDSADRLKIYLGCPPDQPWQTGRTLSTEGTIGGGVYRSGEAICIRPDEFPDLATQYPGSVPLLAEFRQQGLKTGCFLPLGHEGRTLGVLALGARAVRELTPTELAYLRELTQLVAAALNNALRFDELSSSYDRLERERNCADQEIRTAWDFDNIVGRSQAMRAVLHQVETVAPTDSAVLILGETGTGKELIARAIHDRSRRHAQAFIKVDCAAIPATLLESELFGYERGAFTGAVTQKLGRLEIADKGTLFLDEIGDLPLELQAKLLRVLQDQAVERLGGNRTRHLDLRVIAATNRDLDEMVAKGEFRADLYYRLKVFPIVIPPLRDRPEDIPPLVWHYVHRYAQRLKKTIDTIPAEAMEAFRRYPWPGNVRELQHFMERSVVLSSGSVLRAPLAALEHNRRQRPAGTQSRTMEDIERESILQALRESNWVVGGPKGAARKLGLKRTTLASRMERLGIHGRNRRHAESTHQ